MFFWESARRRSRRSDPCSGVCKWRHELSDVTGRYHADYVSGWDQHFLQDVPDRCDNDPDAATPGSRCENFLTHRDVPKIRDDGPIVKKRKKIRPRPRPHPQNTITTEKIEGREKLPRRACTGTILPPRPAGTQAYYDCGRSRTGGRGDDRKYQRRVCRKCRGGCAHRFGEACVDAAQQKCRECGCADGTEWMIDGRNCCWVGTRQAQRCGRYNEEGAAAEDMCPWTCGSCPGG